MAVDGGSTAVSFFGKGPDILVVVFCELEAHRGWQAAEKQHGEKACSLFTGVH